ncbi:MAG: HAMP domain-containing sensor histidine kinase [Bacteroidota bacterium]
MTKPTQQIGIWLLLVGLLPVALFSLNQVNSLNETERVLTQLYQEQLETLIFSVNQYADDVVQNSWIGKLNEVDMRWEGWDQEYLAERREIVGLFFMDINSQADPIWYVKEDKWTKDRIDVGSILAPHAAEWEKLFRYLDAGGYQKKVPLRIPNDPNHMMLVFAHSKWNGSQTLCGIIFDIDRFVYERIGPRLKQLAQERFVFIVRNDQSEKPTFFTQNNFQGSLQQIKPLQLVPHYQVEMYVIDGTIETAIEERATQNMYLILGVGLVLLVGLILVFRTIQRQLMLAQYKTDFVSNVSHELRTPLALIRMFAETLELNRISQPEKRDEYVKIIRQESERLTGMVNKILNFSQTAARKRLYDMEEVDLNEVVQSVMNTYEFHLKQHGFTWEMELTEAPSIVCVDEGAIAEALVNLIDNAIKYSPDEKRLTISTSVHGKQAHLAVQDHGIGISPQHQKAVFDKFFRVTEGELYTVKGTGLGLALVKQIMDAHKGKVKLESTAGKGSTFSLVIPTCEKTSKEDK